MAVTTVMPVGSMMALIFIMSVVTMMVQIAVMTYVLMYLMDGKSYGTKENLSRAHSLGHI
jgi:hypothetical protein